FSGKCGLHLVLDWAPEILGGGHTGRYSVDRLDGRDLARMRDAAVRLDGPHVAQAVADLIALLRANGLPFDRFRSPDLGSLDASPDQAVHDAVGDGLSRIEHHPDILEVGEKARAHPRAVHRRLRAIADRYALPWSHWRSALHYTRILNALRLLGVP